MRITVTEDEIEGLRITIPARRHWWITVFCPIWLCGWAVGEVVVTIQGIGMIGSGEAWTTKGPTLLFLLVWLSFWTLGGLLVMLALWWSLAGKEVITLGDDALVSRRELGTLKRARVCDLARVRNLRYSPVPFNPFSFRSSLEFQLQFMGVAGGSVAFDHDGKTHRFGSNLTETEALRLIATIQQRYKIPENRDVEPLPVANL